MKKKTAKRLIVVLVISYLFLISGGVILWLTSRSNNTAQTTLSEADASDNVVYGENEQDNGQNNVSGDEQNSADQGEQSEQKDNDETQVSDETSQEQENITEEDSQEVTSDFVRMLFTGDVYIGNYVSSVYDVSGVNGVLSDYLLEQFQTANLAMVNQEFPFSTRGEPMEDKQYTFRVDPSKVSLLNEMSVDIVSLANNHALDYGTDALLDSMDTLTNAGITYVGVGSNLTEAKTTRYMECNGKTIAILSASRVIPVSEWGATATSAGMFTTYDPTALLEEITIAREQADIVVVYLHWGLEKKEYPESYQRVMGQQFIDAGADVVIGSHPHVLQGFEYYNGKLIVYSLGNFIFSQTIDQTALLTIDVNAENQLEYQITPCKTVNGKTQELTDSAEITAVYEYLSSISENAILDDEGYIIQP